MSFLSERDYIAYTLFRLNKFLITSMNYTDSEIDPCSTVVT